MTTTNVTTEERLSRLEGAYEHLATKADIADTKAEIANNRAEIAEVKALIAELRADMEQKFANQTRWFVGFMLTGMAFMTGVAFGVGRLLQ